MRIIHIVERHLGRALGHKWVEMPVDISDAGDCPAATHFLCFAKESKQRKATRAHRRAKKPRDSLRYSKRPAAAELLGRITLLIGANNVASSSNSPRGMPLSLFRCSATLNGNSTARMFVASPRMCIHISLHAVGFFPCKGKMGDGVLRNMTPQIS